MIRTSIFALGLFSTCAFLNAQPVARPLPSPGPVTTNDAQLDLTRRGIKHLPAERRLLAYVPTPTPCPGADCTPAPNADPPCPCGPGDVELPDPDPDQDPPDPCEESPWRNDPCVSFPEVHRTCQPEYLSTSPCPQFDVVVMPEAEPVPDILGFCDLPEDQMDEQANRDYAYDVLLGYFNFSLSGGSDYDMTHYQARAIQECQCIELGVRNMKGPAFGSEFFQVTIISYPDWRLPGIQEITFAVYDTWSGAGGEDEPVIKSVSVNVTQLACGYCRPTLATRECLNGLIYICDFDPATTFLQFEEHHYYDFTLNGSSQGSDHHTGSETVIARTMKAWWTMGSAGANIVTQTGWAYNDNFSPTPWTYESGVTIRCRNTCTGLSRSTITDNYRATDLNISTDAIRDYYCSLDVKDRSENSQFLFVSVFEVLSQEIWVDRQLYQIGSGHLVGGTFTYFKTIQVPATIVDNSAEMGGDCTGDCNECITVVWGEVQCSD